VTRILLITLSASPLLKPRITKADNASSFNLLLGRGACDFSLPSCPQIRYTLRGFANSFDALQRNVPEMASISSEVSDESIIGQCLRRHRNREKHPDISVPDGCEIRTASGHPRAPPMKIKFNMGLVPWLGVVSVI
jgi:hypothetical protein